MESMAQRGSQIEGEGGVRRLMCNVMKGSNSTIDRDGVMSV
jgi:hypothetical protein